jgi:hypothetical protein
MSVVSSIYVSRKTAHQQRNERIGSDDLEFGLLVPDFVLEGTNSLAPEDLDSKNILCALADGPAVEFDHRIGH